MKEFTILEGILLLFLFGFKTLDLARETDKLHSREGEGTAAECKNGK
jgi:hypothetical protein